MKQILLASLLLASCGQGGAPDIRVTDAWARAMVAGQTSAAAYMTIVNHGSGADRLVEVTAPPPAMAMVHETSSSGGVSSMRAKGAGAPVGADETLDLKPLGTHVMVTGLTQPLKAGSTLPLTLRFERSGERRVGVRIVDASAMGPR